MINLAEALVASGAGDGAAELLALAVVVGGVLFSLFCSPIPADPGASPCPCRPPCATRRPAPPSSVAGHAPAPPAPSTPLLSGTTEAQRVVYHHASTCVDVEVDRLVYELRAARR